jgi:hypothetical protein
MMHKLQDRLKLLLLLLSNNTANPIICQLCLWEETGASAKKPAGLSAERRLALFT